MTFTFQIFEQEKLISKSNLLIADINESLILRNCRNRGVVP